MKSEDTLITAGDIPGLVSAYYTESPEGEVTFGTSGHRGSSLNGTFNEAHILAISQAICEIRMAKGPVIIGKDTHALSEPASRTVLEVFAGNGVDVILAEGYAPTPVVSHALLKWNFAHEINEIDAVILTPSHNPPEDGGLKYNPSHGGPADGYCTGRIQERARELMASGLKGVKRIPYKKALNASRTSVKDLMTPYIEDLSSVIDMEAIRVANLAIGVDPMGGAAVHYWGRIAEHYNVEISMFNDKIDPAFEFMPLDHDDKVRMDCSSWYAMQNLIGMLEFFDIAFGNDPDVDRHGIVTKSSGLLNPNHYLAAASEYLLTNRPEWPADAHFEKTIVTSSMIDRVAKRRRRKVLEMPVGFKWFVDGLYDETCGFASEESAGASFLRRDGTVWTTDKDGIIMGLLAAEMLAVTELDPGEIYEDLINRHGEMYYKRIDSPATSDQREILAELSVGNVKAKELAGDRITAKLTKARGNHEPIGGLKVTTKNGWFAARPSGTENLYKIYAESFVSEEHLHQILEEAQSIVKEALSI